MVPLIVLFLLLQMRGLVALEFDCATKSFLDAQSYWMETGNLWCVLLDYFFSICFWGWVDLWGCQVRLWCGRCLL